MSRFLPYSPEQAYLLPPSVKDELGEDHLSMFVHRVVERLDLREFENAYSDEGGELYAEAAARDASVPHPRTGQGGHRVHARGPSL